MEREKNIAVICGVIVGLLFATISVCITGMNGFSDGVLCGVVYTATSSATYFSMVE